MKPVTLKPVTKPLQITLDDHPVRLSPTFQSEVENFWTRFNSDSRFTRGEVFHVDALEEKDKEIKLHLKSTDYAHYLYSVKNEPVSNEGCRVIYGAGLVETSDSYFVFGEMNKHTAYPGRLQCVGGGLSREDLQGNEFQLRISVLREMTEELGIHKEHVTNCSPCFVKTGGTYDFITVLFYIQLDLTLNQLKERYKAFCEELMDKGEIPEFAEMITIKNEPVTIKNFINNDIRSSVDYLFPLLKKANDFSVVPSN
ncbi:hypothetical protein AWM68_01680 [Fictibacillus phosphorivorans]|uniref:Nudix hydrolase domain-containing protein n=1 Tax=Fictibacillus phosphorivorans TaxID=1221500 RepID=A0A163SG43_9BACL|nr:hypothetical protein [Fictibacillus phosphorivorans]KZE69002.1 hypothetical protein AWM68_01680 [Fictibacillus phosphorivorans]